MADSDGLGTGSAGILGRLTLPIVTAIGARKGETVGTRTVILPQQRTRRGVAGWNTRGGQVIIQHPAPAPAQVADPAAAPAPKPVVVAPNAAPAPVAPAKSAPKTWKGR